MNRHHDRSVAQLVALDTGDQIESKARNPRFLGPSPLQTRRVLRVVHIIFVHGVRPARPSSIPRPPVLVALSPNPVPEPPCLHLVLFLGPLFLSPFDQKARALLFPSFPHPLPLPACASFFVPPSSRFFPTLSLRTLLLPPSGRPSRRTLAGQPQSSSARLPSSRGPATPTATRSSCTRARGAQRLEEVQEDTRGEAVYPLLATGGPRRLSFHSSRNRSICAVETRLLYLSMVNSGSEFPRL